MFSYNRKKKGKITRNDVEIEKNTYDNKFFGVIIHHKPCQRLHINNVKIRKN